MSATLDAGGGWAGRRLTLGELVVGGLSVGLDVVLVGWSVKNSEG